jgi:hypothetical protein
MAHTDATFILGLDAKIYRQTTGTRAAWPATGAAPNLDELTNVKDVTINLETGEADVTTRGGNGWRQTAQTLKDGTVEFEMVWDPGDADFTAIKDAWLNGTNIALAVLDGDSATAGVQGLWADFQITNFSVSQPLEEATTVAVTAKPARSDVAPEWITVGS